MQIDITSYNDLSIFHTEEEFSVFHKLNFTRTAAGKEWLVRYFREPFDQLDQIHATQQVLKSGSPESFRMARSDHQWHFAGHGKIPGL